MNTTYRYQSSILAVLQQTSVDREYLDRLRSFGLYSLIDAYLLSIDTADGTHIGALVRPPLPPHAGS